DGIFEQLVGPQTLTAMLNPGLVGISITSSCQLDNFKFYDGVLLQKTGSVPKTGTVYNMRFVTPAAQYTPLIAGFSLSNTGTPFGNRAIPLAADALLALTLGNASALGLTGLIDANGEGQLAFPVPNNPALVGFAFYAAAITVDGTK